MPGHGAGAGFNESDSLYRSVSRHASAGCARLFTLFGAIRISIAIVICSALQYIEANLVSPLIMKNALRLHPVVGIFGIYIFGSLLGVVGMIFSSLIMHCLLIIYQDFLKPIILDVKLEKNGQIVYNCDEIDEKDE